MNRDFQRHAPKAPFLVVLSLYLACTSQTVHFRRFSPHFLESDALVYAIYSNIGPLRLNLFAVDHLKTRTLLKMFKFF